MSYFHISGSETRIENKELVPKQEILEVESQGQLQGFQERAPVSSECGDAQQDRREKPLGDPSLLKIRESPTSQISGMIPAKKETSKTKNSGPVPSVQTLFLVRMSQQQGDPSLGINMGTTASTG